MNSKDMSHSRENVLSYLYKTKGEWKKLTDICIGSETPTGSIGAILFKLTDIGHIKSTTMDNEMCPRYQITNDGVEALREQHVNLIYRENQLRTALGRQKRNDDETKGYKNNRS
jgi:DNA-binding PadR family transcriptional regulator